MSAYPFRFNPHRVIERYGGVNNTYTILKSMNSTLTPRSIRNWMWRGSVPADAIVMLHLYDVRTSASYRYLYDVRMTNPSYISIFDGYYQEGFEK